MGDAAPATRSIQVSPEVHGELEHLAGELAIPPARPPTFGDLISFLIASYRKRNRGRHINGSRAKVKR